MARNSVLAWELTCSVRVRYEGQGQSAHVQAGGRGVQHLRSPSAQGPREVVMISKGPPVFGLL